MPKGSRNVPVGSRLARKGRKSRKKRQDDRGPVLSEAQRVLPQVGVATPTVVKREESLAEQTVSQLPALLRDLKRTAIVAGLLLLLLIVLYVVL